MAFGGAALRLGQTGLRSLQLLAAIVLLALFSYFLAVLSDHHKFIPTWLKAVEGISGAAVLYLLFAVLFTLFLGGIAFFGFIAVVLDIAFVGAFIYVVWETRHGAGTCKGYVRTPLGNGQANAPTPYGSTTWLPNLHQACQLESATFAVALIMIFLFLITAVMQVLLVRHHKKEKHQGPSPSNNYSSNSRRPFWKRNKKVHNTRDAEMATAGTVRPSHDTGYTGTTTGNGVNGLDESKYGQPGYGQTNYTVPVHNTTTSNYQ
jgi:hypothetical protein